MHRQHQPPHPFGGLQRYAFGAQRRLFPVGYERRPAAGQAHYRGSLKDLEGSTVYVTLFPCHDCAKILAQVGVGEVVYLDNKYADTDDGRISRRILDSCGISYRQVIVDVHIGTEGQAQQ